MMLVLLTVMYSLRLVMGTEQAFIFFCGLGSQIIATNTTMHLSDIIANIPNIIHQEYSTNLTDYHQHSILALYKITFHHFYTKIPDALQSQCISLMHLMINQNIKMGINMDVSVWNAFFAVYYAFYNHLIDTAYYQYLNEMKVDGSKTEPNLETFNVILTGISTNKGINNPELMANIIINKIMKSHEIEPNESTYKSLLLIFAKTHNYKAATVLLLDHNIDILADGKNWMSSCYLLTFANADVNGFNEILQLLSVKYSAHKTNLQQLITFIVTEIMSHYQIQPNKNTVCIIRSLSRVNKKFKGDLF
eukprot:531605_1